MATSGRSWLLGLGLGAVLLTGCTPSAPGPAQSPPTSAVPTPAPPSSTGSVASTPTPAPAGASATVAPTSAKPCRVALPSGWQRGLKQGVVKPAKGETLTVVLGAGDGTTFMVVSGPHGRHALEWRRGTEHGIVQDFGTDHPEWQVLGATYDGRHLAYRIDQSYSSFEDFALYVWDSRGAGSRCGSPRASPTPTAT